mgnify:CR=1 FL=1
MAKFKVNYTETLTHTYIVEADTEEEALEKMEYAAENIPGLTTDRDFDYWDIEVEREANTDALERFDGLPEE